MNLLAYVVITPARNEAEFIELTITSMIAQTIRPLKWVIVSDGSTDGTDEIVQKYAGQHSWIKLVRMPERRERHFAGKVHAFNTGYAEVKGLPYEVVCSLDSDISFEEDYFSFLLGNLAADPSLGLVGTPFREGNNRTYDYRFVNIEHVSGACQVFRRACFEAIGGYVPVKGGGIDHIAVLSARMKGWKTRTFVDKVCDHHRKMGAAHGSELASRFDFGRRDYVFGNHPLWELFRVFYQMARKPFLIGGLMLASGYLWALIRRIERPVSHEVVTFYRNEQMKRLKRAFSRNRLFHSKRLRQPPECAS